MSAYSRTFGGLTGGDSGAVPLRRVLVGAIHLRIPGVVVALAVVGCSGSAAPASPSSVTIASVASPSPSPTLGPTAVPTPTPSPTPAPGFAATGSMSVARQDATATLLKDGRVLIAGGEDSTGVLSSAELYEPKTGTFSATGSMTDARVTQTATLLSDGRVLMAGGRDNAKGISSWLSSAEVYDPTTGTFSRTGSMKVRRMGPAATLLRDGRVLILGGSDGLGGESTQLAELYDPQTGKFTPGGKLAARVPKYSVSSTLLDGHSATLLSDGRVLIAGGQTAWGMTTVAAAELYEPSTGKFSPTGSMAVARSKHSATLLSDGRVLIAGGMTFDRTTNKNKYFDSGELYDPATGKFSSTGAMAFASGNGTTTLLSDGRVLITGGTDGTTALTSAQLYDPISGSFSKTSSMSVGRIYAASVGLADGRVLIAGGMASFQNILASAELYQP
jgi:Galactose oxidase, central domain/Kelch motif